MPDEQEDEVEKFREFLDQISPGRLRRRHQRPRRRPEPALAAAPTLDLYVRVVGLTASHIGVSRPACVDPPPRPVLACGPERRRCNSRGVLPPSRGTERRVQEVGPMSGAARGSRAWRRRLHARARRPRSPAVRVCCSATTSCRCPPTSATAVPSPAPPPGSPTASSTTGRAPGSSSPSVRTAHGSGSQRLYSFRDILVLKVVKRLLDTGVSLQNIRIAVEHLRERGVDDLAQVTLMSDGASGLRVPQPGRGHRPGAGRSGRVRHRGRPGLARGRGQPRRAPQRARRRRHRRPAESEPATSSPRAARPAPPADPARGRSAPIPTAGRVAAPVSSHAVLPRPGSLRAAPTTRAGESRRSQRRAPKEQAPRQPLRHTDRPGMAPLESGTARLPADGASRSLRTAVKLSGARTAREQRGTRPRAPRAVACEPRSP